MAETLIRGLLKLLMELLNYEFFVLRPAGYLLSKSFSFNLVQISQEYVTEARQRTEVIPINFSSLKNRLFSEAVL